MPTRRDPPASHADGRSANSDQRPSLFDRRLSEAATYAYEDWLEECIRVRNAYARWSRGRATDGEKFFAAYLSALDGERLAADQFQKACARLRGRPAASVT